MADDITVQIALNTPERTSGIGEVNNLERVTPTREITGEGTIPQERLVPEDEEGVVVTLSEEARGKAVETASTETEGIQNEPPEQQAEADGNTVNGIFNNQVSSFSRSTDLDSAAGANTGNHIEITV